MEARALGSSSIRVSPIGLGCWQFSNRIGLAGKFWPSLSEVPAREIIQASLEGGVNWFDTAEMYGKGASEECLSSGLHALEIKPGEVVIATKWHPVGRTARSMLRTIETRKRYLGAYPIDLYQIHLPASFSSIEGEMEAMAQLLEQGDIRAAGVSNYSASQMRHAHEALAKQGYPLVSNQVRYSLLHREIEENGVLETARELGITIIAYSPLDQGLLSGRFHDAPKEKRKAGLRRFRWAYRSRGLKKTTPLIETLREVAETHGASPAQVALNWLITFHGEMVVAIPGATKTYQAENNAAAMRLSLSAEDLARIDEVSRRLQ